MQCINQIKQVCVDELTKLIRLYHVKRKSFLPEYHLCFLQVTIMHSFSYSYSQDKPHAKSLIGCKENSCICLAFLPIIQGIALH